MESLTLEGPALRRARRFARTRSARLLGRCLAVLILAGPLGAAAVTIDFSSQPPGKFITDEFLSTNDPGIAPGEGFSVTTTNLGGGPDVATLYDSSLTGGEDDDIEGPPGTNWAGGNLSNPQTGVGNLIIIQESATQAELNNGQLNFASGRSNQGPGFAPDDEAGGGILQFDFESQLEALAFAWIDLDGGVVGSFNLDFTNTVTGDSVNLEFGAFEDVNSPFYDPSIVWDHHYANLIESVTAQALASAFGVPIESFNQVTFNMGGSGGIGFITYIPKKTPEPGTAALVLFGLVVLRSTRRMREALMTD